MAIFTDRLPADLQNLSFDEQNKDVSLLRLFMHYWHNRQGILNLNALENKKNSNAAFRARTEGNRYYKEKNFDKALEYYNKSICLSSTEYSQQDDTLQDKSLALSYGNRSALFFELGLYDEAILDIKRALDNNYPNDSLQCKLLQRQIKCFIAMERFEEARELIDALGIKVDDLGLESSYAIKTSFLNYLEKSIMATGFTKDGEDSNLNNSKTTHPKPFFLQYQNIFSPTIENPNPNFPALSNAVNIEYSKSKGRHMVANRDIRPGEIIASERCFAHLWNAKSEFTCLCCLNRTFNPVPCPTCSLVKFCNEECQNEGMKFHEIECLIWNSSKVWALPEEARQYAMLALRIVISMGIEGLKEKITYCKLPVGSESYGANLSSEEIFSSTDYKTIYNLKHNISKVNHDTIALMSMISVMMLEALLATGKFFDNSLPMDQLTNDIFLCGSVLQHNFLIIWTNAYTLSNLAYNKNDLQSSFLSSYAIAIYSTSSLVNHSCELTLYRMFYGQHVVLHSVSFIKKGQEIRDNYGHEYQLRTREERQAKLFRSFYFTCNCVPCHEDWPTVERLSYEFRLKCLCCSTGIIMMRNGQCKDCNEWFPATVTEFGKKFNHLNLVKEIKTLTSEKNTYLSNIEKRIEKESTKYMLDKLMYLHSKYIKQPSIHYINVLVLTKLWYDMEGCYHRVV